MYKACSRCGKIHPTKYRCKAGNSIDYNKYKTEDDKLRNTYNWHKKSEEIKEASNYLCEVCRDSGVYTYDNLEVHHIVKVREDKSLLLDNNNLICLCWKHHKLADKGEVSIEYLKKLVNIRENKN